MAPGGLSAACLEFLLKIGSALESLITTRIRFGPVSL
jgi:hypothetical protein